MRRLEGVLTRPWAVAFAVAILIALPLVVLGEVAANEASRQARADEIRLTATTAARAADVASARVFAVRDQLIAMHAALFPSPNAPDKRVPAATNILRDSTSAPSSSDASAAPGIEVLRQYRLLLGREITRLAFSWHGTAAIAEPPGGEFVTSYAQTRSLQYAIASQTASGGVSLRPTPSYSSVYRSELDGPAMAVATSVASPIAGGVATFAAELDLRDLRVALAAVLPDRGDIYVIDGAGLLIARGTATEMAVLSPVSYVPRAGTAGEAADPITGAQRLVAAVAVDQLRWTVVVVRDAATASAAADQARVLRVAIVLLLLLGSYVIATATSAAIRQRRLLATANAQLAAATVAKSKFLASMSHELRTPMNAVIGFTDVLLEGIYGPLNEEQRTSLGYVRQGGHDLLALVNDVLDLSKIEAERIELAPERFAPLDFVQLVLAQLRPIAAADGTSLLWVDDGAPAELNADPGRVRQIITNLVSNALKFAKGGEVGVSVSRAGDRVAIAVRDTGRGVPAAQREAIFEEFRQARADDEGTGLGLPISRRLARLMGGDITLESEEGRGSTFTLVLPLEAKVPASQRLPAASSA